MLPPPATPTLTVGDVRQIRVERAKINHETYKGILQKVYDRIRRRAAMNASALDFAVPPFVPGRPVFEHSHAVRYVTEKLRLGGFGVTPAGADGVLRVDWSAPAPAPAAARDGAPRCSRSRPADPADPKAAPQDLKRSLDNLKRRLQWT